MIRRSANANAEADGAALASRSGFGSQSKKLPNWEGVSDVWSAGPSVGRQSTSSEDGRARAVPPLERIFHFRTSEWGD